MVGIDLTTVKELLGHKDVKMTLRYSNLAASHIKNAVSILDRQKDIEKNKKGIKKGIVEYFNDNLTII